jgi:hypothetical protein
MVCVVVPLLLKRNFGVLFGVLAVMPPFFFFACYGSVSLWCLLVSFLLCFEAQFSSKPHMMTAYGTVELYGSLHPHPQQPSSMAQW